MGERRRWPGKFGIYSKALLKSSPAKEINLLRIGRCQVPRKGCFLVIPTLEQRIFFKVASNVCPTASVAI